MPGRSYYRKQADICAALALSAGDQNLRARHNTLALEQVARAAEAGTSEESSFEEMPLLTPDDGGSDMDRDQT